MSAVVDVVVRSARVYAPLMLVACCVCAVATVVLGVKAATARVSVVAEAPAGQPILLSKDHVTGGLTVLAATAAGASIDTQDTCELSGGRRGDLRVSPDYGTGGPTITRDGQRLTRFVTVESTWRDGEQLVCRGPHLRRVVVVQAGRTGLLLWTGLLAFMTVGTGLLAVFFRRLRRWNRHARPVAA